MKYGAGGGEMGLGTADGKIKMRLKWVLKNVLWGC